MNIWFNISIFGFFFAFVLIRNINWKTELIILILFFFGLVCKNLTETQWAIFERKQKYWKFNGMVEWNSKKDRCWWFRTLNLGWWNYELPLKWNCVCDFVMLAVWLLGNDWMLFSISNLIWSRYTENVLMLTIVDDVQSVCFNESATNDSSTENTRQLKVPYWNFTEWKHPNQMHHIQYEQFRMRLPLEIGHVCILRLCANNCGGCMGECNL